MRELSLVRPPQGNYLCKELLPKPSKKLLEGAPSSAIVSFIDFKIMRDLTWECIKGGRDISEHVTNEFKSNDRWGGISCYRIPDVRTLQCLLEIAQNLRQCSGITNPIYQNASDGCPMSLVSSRGGVFRGRAGKDSANINARSLEVLCEKKVCSICSAMKSQHAYAEGQWAQGSGGEDMQVCESCISTVMVDQVPHFPSRSGPALSFVEKTKTIICFAHDDARDEWKCLGVRCLRWSVRWLCGV